MRLDNVKLGRKLLLPVAFSTFAIVCVGAIGSVKLNSIASAANGLVQRDIGSLFVARASRRVAMADGYAYAALMTDDQSAYGKRVAAEFQPTIKAAHDCFEQAARLLPDKAATIRAFDSRLADLEGNLKQVFEIGERMPGFDSEAAFSAANHALLVQGVRLMNNTALELDHLGEDLSALNEKLTAENQRGGADLSAESFMTIVEIAVGGFLSAIAAAAFALWLSTAKIARPLIGITHAMQRLAGGDNGVAVEGSDRGDEVGAMARAVQIFKDNAIEKTRLEADAVAARRASEAEKARQDAMKAKEAEQQKYVVETIAKGLDLLSNGRLTHRVEEAFPESYERLRADFNAAMQRMQETVSVVSLNTDAISSGTKEISTASDDLARRTEQQAASLEETAAALQQISETVRKTADGANHARSLITLAQNQAEQSGLVVSEAITAMSAIDKSSEQMGQIIGVIDEIAFQTNLLALNAGVEAARAGEAGRGFAVVASEVRALAQRSAEAAKEIKVLITNSSDQVEHGVDLVGRTGKALSAILNSINEITKIVSSIADGTKEQSNGLAEITIAVSQMDKTTQQNAAMVEESTAATHALAQETAELSKIVGVFDVGVPSPAKAPTGFASREERGPRAEARRPALRKVANGRAVAAPSDEEWAEF